jgi:uncharacterized repeat protein (TIGR03803 family)
LFLAPTALFLHGQTFTTVANFNGTNGAGPGVEPLVEGLDGNFYGTTPSGGAQQKGVIFRVTPQGVLTVLYNFCSQPNCTDGNGPHGGLILARDGNFYGTTAQGGSENIKAGGNGTIYRITPQGAYTVMHSFCGAACAEGQSPYYGVIQAAGETFFGTTLAGGTNGMGTVYKMSPAGVVTTIYDFCPESGCADGVSPMFGVTQATNGKFYGLTSVGTYRQTFYRITSTGQFANLYTFCLDPVTCTDGTNSWGGLVQGDNGNFFGTNNGVGAGGGTVFEITSQGQLTVLYTFCGKSKCPDGSGPLAGLTLATDGNFYGSTFFGGTGVYDSPGSGTLFQITPQGAFTSLHSFCTLKGCPDGSGPDSTLIQGTDGSLWGVTPSGGGHGKGIVFNLAVGLQPFVRLSPAFGKTGAKIIVYGSNLAGTTQVSFNGVAASFTAVSATEITALVPAGASSGNVQVTTPGETLLSNVVFAVQ